ncbi:MAG: hypothetical protein HC906_10775 [Bacteroidales bacterium]|nr:hypothetical protein [Bacteroidales bacterium]
MQWLRENGYFIWASIWDVADFLVSNPTQSYARQINSTDEFAELIYSYLKYAKDSFQVEPDFYIGKRAHHCLRKRMGRVPDCLNCTGSARNH